MTTTSRLRARAPCRIASSPLLAFADDLDRRVVFEQPAEAAPHQGVIVGEQDREFGVIQSPWPRRPGRVSRTSVPPSRGSRNSSVPPSSSARSRIATSPRPAARGPVPRPLPVILDLELEAAVLAPKPDQARLTPECRATLLIASCSTR